VTEFMGIAPINFLGAVESPSSRSWLGTCCESTPPRNAPP